MGIKKAREALTKAIDVLAKLHDDEERLVKSLKPFDDNPPTGTMAHVAAKLYKDLEAVHKLLPRAVAEHDSAIKEMARAWEKHMAKK